MNCSIRHLLFTTDCQSMPINSFMKWAEEHGAQHDGIQIRDINGCKGIFARRDFRENEILMRIPSEMIITAGSIAEMPQYRSYLKRCRLLPFEALVLFFIVEDPCSSWAPYRDILPKAFSTPLITLPDLEAGNLPDNVKKLWIDQRNEVNAMYKKIANIAPEVTSWNHFLWAWHVVNTRCIYRTNVPHPLIDNSKGDQLAIVPLLDMLNHSNDSQCCAVWDSISMSYMVVAVRPVHENCQIYICYGAHMNSVLWIDYGFMLPNNICNKVDIPLEKFIALAKTAGISSTGMHKEIMKQANFPCTIYASDVTPNFGLKANVALMMMDIKQLKCWPKTIYAKAESVPMELLLRILKLLRDEYSEKRQTVAEKVQWLWDEQIAVIDNVLTSQN